MILFFNDLVCLPSLDKIACEFLTDKCSFVHNYTVIYEQYLERFRNSPIKFLEIGIDQLSSAKMWDHYFQHPKARLIFLDINNVSVDNCRESIKNHILSDRIQGYEADQANKDMLIDLFSQIGDEFDVIIDDGGHTMVQQITSFCTLFPYVKKGGLYIIEDLHTSYWNAFGGGGTQINPVAGPGTTLKFLADLIDDVNYPGGITGIADVNKCLDDKLLNYYQRHIKSIHFYNSICFIIKY